MLRSPGGKKARKATIVVVDHPALLHPAGGTELASSLFHEGAQMLPKVIKVGG